MSAFDRVIGYESIKTELLQIIDMIRNRAVYEEMGARMPQGVLLYGDPGLGKTLMARCLIEESGFKTYTLRKNKGTGDFALEIADIFRRAKEAVQAIVFLDDLDKFANEDERHCDAEEYVAVQSGIDEVKGTDVFILATANNIDKLPRSLTRSGRFDRKIEVPCPTTKDSEAIIRHYLMDKTMADDVDPENLTMMMNFSSCAELETILNEAAVCAAFDRRDRISMEDLTKTVLRMQYHTSDNCVRASEDGIRKAALHEAGHIVVCEVLCPGSVGLASLLADGSHSANGFVRRCREFTRRPYHILVSLAGKAAVELTYSETCASGCQSDIDKAIRQIRDAVCESGACGLGMIDFSDSRSRHMSESMTARVEAVICAELERYMLKARDILLKNRAFLERTTAALFEKGTLLYSDIRDLREGVTIVEVAV